jgi:ribosome-associated toxin RatA of RatAB toxin-antitoxin module
MHASARYTERIGGVERYPQFVPLCEALRVRWAGDGYEIVTAAMADERNWTEHNRNCVVDAFALIIHAFAYILSI